MVPCLRLRRATRSQNIAARWGAYPGSSGGQTVGGTQPTSVNGFDAPGPGNLQPTHWEVTMYIGGGILVVIVIVVVLFVVLR